MALGTEFPVITTGNLYTAIDTYASTITTQPPTNSPSYPNGAQNPAGSTFLLSPGASEGPTIAYPGAGSLNSNGWGAPLIVRYVRYNSTTNAALLAYPAPVYWTDETFTNVSGTFTEGIPNSTGNANSLAGMLLINTTQYPGSKTGSQLATILNGNWCFIVTRGFVPKAYVPSGVTVWETLIGAAGNFTLAAVASGSYPGGTPFFQALQAIQASAYADVLVNTELTY